MRKQKPLRTLKAPLFPPDHFTLEEARAAVLAVMAERGETPVFDVVEEVSTHGVPLRRPSGRSEAA
jgi:hypothetical protein